MHWLEIAGIAVALAMDAFAVSIVAGTVISRVTPRHVFRLAFHFGLFQFLMPVVGWAAGTALAGWIDAWDHWVAFGLLVFIGAKMLVESRARKHPDDIPDPTRGWMLVSLSVATSIDALAAGMSIALMGVDILMPALVIGIVTASLCTVGIFTGGRIGRRYGRAAILLGGLVLIGIGLRILIFDLYAG
jgi:putative Mn2+ efflux pump MntP